MEASPSIRECNIGIFFWHMCALPCSLVNISPVTSWNTNPAFRLPATLADSYSSFVADGRFLLVCKSSLVALGSGRLSGDPVCVRLTVWISELGPAVNLWSSGDAHLMAVDGTWISSLSLGALWVTLALSFSKQGIDAHGVGRCIIPRMRGISGWSVGCFASRCALS